MKYILKRVTEVLIVLSVIATVIYHCKEHPKKENIGNKIRNYLSNGQT